jgi:Kef-type K+ transport system membrane component KefB
MVIAAIALLVLICRQGETLQAPSDPAAAALQGGSANTPNVLLRILIALTAVIVVGLILARCFAYIGQPPVIGEVVAGILLGPSLLGPEASALILPTAIAPFLGVIAQLGVVLYMFTVGLSLQGERLKHRARTAVAISHASIVLPFLLGALLAMNL